MSTENPNRSSSSRRTPKLRPLAVLVAACGFAICDPVLAADSETGPSSDPSHERDFQLLPGIDDPDIRRLWREGIDLERASDFLASNARYQRIADRLVSSSDPHWRMAHNYYLQSKTYPADVKDEQIHYLELADQTADRGLELDPECAECMLWKYAALGRLPTLRGLISGAANAKTLAKLLERGIEITSNDSSETSTATLANFYYASSSFYRMVPDWFWLPWVFGVQGNKERALRDARQAVALADTRVEYQVELGAALLCFGATKSQPESTREGIDLLERIKNLPSLSSSDESDSELAHALLQSPGRACEFSRAGFLDVESVAAAKGD